MDTDAANQADSVARARPRRPQRFRIRRDAGGRGISAEIELDAVDAADARTRAAALFSHERVTATYDVTAVRSQEPSAP